MKQRYQAVMGTSSIISRLSGMLNGLMKEAQDAAAGLKSAADEHSATVGRIKTVTATVRAATAKSNDLLNQMMGGNGPPLDGSSTTTTSEPSPPASPQS
jgi:membrane protein involved in colicin uptake